MPSEMTLKLTLSGVPQLIQSIQALNRALARLNSQFGQSASAVANMANRVSRAAGNLKQATQRPGRIGGRSGGQGNNNLQDMFDQQGWASVAFSGFAQAWSIMFAKIMTRLTVDLANSLYRSSPANPANAPKFQIQGANGQTIDVIPANVQSAWNSKLAGITTMITKVAIAIAALYAVVQSAVAVIKWWGESVKNSVATFWKTGGTAAVAGQLRGIQAALNLDPSSIQNAANAQPGMGRTLVHKLRILRGMKNDELAAYFARAHGLQDFMGVRDLSEKDFRKAMNEQLNVTPDKRKSIAEFNAALGGLKKTFDDLALGLSPFIRGLTNFLKMITAIVNFIRRTFEDSVIGKIYGMIDKLSQNSDDMKDAARDFREGVDKFTEKTGTFGGGNRGNNPIPRSWTWWNYQDQLIGAADAMGAFEF